MREKKTMNPNVTSRNAYVRAAVLLLGLAGVWFGVRAGAGENRTIADTAADLQQTMKSEKLTYEQMRAVREALGVLQDYQVLKGRQEQRKTAEATLRRVLCEAAEANPSDRNAVIAAARLLLFLGDPEGALKYLTRARPASAEDVEWPLLCTRAYLQLGDFEKAAGMSAQVDSLLQGRSQLQLSKPVAVEQVTGYRLYVPAATAKPAPGDMLTLYVEISGAKFSPISGGSRCCLDFGLELRDEVQNVVDSNEAYGRYDPVYIGPVRDLHATIYYRLPEKIEPGKYVLIVRCVDALNNNIKAQSEYPFSVGSSSRPQVPADTKAKAEMYMQKFKAGDIDDIEESFKEEKKLRELQRKNKEKQKNGDAPAEEGKTDAQKLGEELLLKQANRNGDAVGK